MNTCDTVPLHGAKTKGATRSARTRLETPKCLGDERRAERLVRLEGVAALPGDDATAFLRSPHESVPRFVPFSRANAIGHPLRSSHQLSDSGYVGISTNLLFANFHDYPPPAPDHPTVSPHPAAAATVHVTTIGTIFQNFYLSIPTCSPFTRHWPLVNYRCL